MQLPLQQLVPEVQDRPLAEQAVAAQRPFVQVPVQQLRMVLQACPFCEQAVAQTPLVHWRPQHSWAEVQLSPLPPQQTFWPTRLPQVFEQQSEASVQASPEAPHALHDPFAQLSEQHWPARVQVVLSAGQLPQTSL